MRTEVRENEDFQIKTCGYEKKEGSLGKHIELIAALLSGLIILLTWSFTDRIPSTLWVLMHLIAFVIGGYHQAREGILDTIENKQLNVELLMIVAAIGSALIGYWTEGAILIFIFALAGALESYTLDRSNREIQSLMDLQPEEARVLRDGVEVLVPLSSLEIGEKVYVKASERIPVDGIVLAGNSSVDESPITGESMPVMKKQESEVFAGTVALDGSLTIEMTKQADETIFQKIIEMIQSAKDEKSPVQLFIERFESTYVYAVLIFVLLMMFIPYLFFGWTLQESIYRAMVLLVVASPCALVASIMPATLSAISKNARKGVLFKGGVHVENLSQMDVIAFDKTGTLTKGQPEVTDVVIHPDYEAAEIHRIVGAIESESTHPLAQSLVSYTLEQIEDSDFDLELDEVKTVSGLGVLGVLEGKTWYIGRKEFVGSQPEDQPFYQDQDQTLANEGKTIVYVGCQGEILALYALKDIIRAEAKEVIQSIRAAGIKTVMLTGDNELTARSVARETGLDHYQSACLPNEKVDYIRKLLNQGKKVAMVGDGINDAPALALADLGIAMGEGTDIALETADVILMKNDLSKIPEAIATSKKMNRIVKQNVFFSLAVILILIISNFLQVIDLPLGVIGHEGSTILVILNGLRMLR